MKTFNHEWFAICFECGEIMRYEIDAIPLSTKKSEYTKACEVLRKDLEAYAKRYMRELTSLDQKYVLNTLWYLQKAERLQKRLTK